MVLTFVQELRHRVLLEAAAASSLTRGLHGLRVPNQTIGIGAHPLLCRYQSCEPCFAAPHEAQDKCI